jgi:hypothetical protein
VTEPGPYHSGLNRIVFLAFHLLDLLDLCHTSPLFLLPFSSATACEIQPVVLNSIISRR